MSRIYFHSEHGEAEVRGAERAYMGNWTSDLLLAAIGPVWDNSTDDQHWLRRLLPPGCYVLSSPNFADTVRTYLRAGWDPLVIDCEKVQTFDIALNTMVAVGNDTLKFMARMHGQCEIHAWVEGPNRKWLAGIVRDGRSSGILRADMGWEDVVSLLTSRSDEPVVTSYSVCAQFPNAGLMPKGHEAHERDGDAFYDVPADEQWRLCLDTLRRDYPSVELKPEGWSDYRFARCMTAFDLRAKAAKGAA